MSDLVLLVSRVRMSSALACALLGLATGCGRGVRVGDNHRSDGGLGEAHDNGSGPEDCVDTQELDALPTDEIHYSTSPALFVESARGVFSNASGDTFSAQIAYPVKVVEIDCVDDATAATASDLAENPIGIPDGAELPYVTFQLQAQIAFRTADGTWDEHFDMTLQLAPHDREGNGTIGLSGNGELTLAELTGTFTLPSESKGTADKRSVYLTVMFVDGGWILNRIIYEQASAEPGHEGLPGVAWSAPSSVFIKPSGSQP